MDEREDGRSGRGPTGRKARVALGAGIGMIFGAALGAIGTGMVLGAALGLAGGFLPKRRKPDRNG